MEVGAGVAGAVLVLGFIVIFNRLVRRSNLVREAWSGVDVQLKRRHDLVTRLVETVKGHASFEDGLLTEIAQLRGEAEAKVAPEIENALADRLLTLVARIEAYPVLSSADGFLDLQRRLHGVEEALQMARRYYNGTVRELNILIESFPSCLVAKVSGTQPASYFQVDSATERVNPRIGEMV